MAELKFVAKCLGITIAVMFCLQFEVHKGVRAESYVSSYLRDGTAVVWIRDSIRGAKMFVMNSSTELAPKLKMGNWIPDFGSKVEPLRNISSDLPEAFPDEAVGDEAEKKAGVF